MRRGAFALQHHMHAVIAVADFDGLRKRCSGATQCQYRPFPQRSPLEHSNKTYRIEVVGDAAHFRAPDHPQQKAVSYAASI
jgi:hypothetical protein